MSSTHLQAMLISRLGINMIYLPVSLLSDSSTFFNFAVSIIVNAADFVRSYNEAISQQIHERKIKPQETIRPLTVESSRSLFELPFWLVLPDGQREPLYTTSNRNGKIKISIPSAELGDFESACDGILKNILNRHGYRLRPKAVTLTLFARLFLGDWFVHGIGGIDYEFITEHILEDYYGIKGLNFGVATATATLLFLGGEDKVSNSELKQQLRNLKYNPEKFIKPSLRKKEPVKSLVAEKQKFAKAAGNRSLSAEEKESAWKSISEINNKLLKFTENATRQANRKIRLLENHTLSQRQRDSREYFFGLFQEANLHELADRKPKCFTKEIK